jgi:hypothetical protein
MPELPCAGVGIKQHQLNCFASRTQPPYRFRQTTSCAIPNSSTMGRIAS